MVPLLAGTVRVVWWTLLASLTKSTPNFFPVPIITAKLTKKTAKRKTAKRLRLFPTRLRFSRGVLRFLMAKCTIFSFQVFIYYSADRIFSLFNCKSCESAIPVSRSERINSLTSCLASSSSVFFSSI